MTIRINTRVDWRGDEFMGIVDESVDIGLGNVAAAGASMAAQSMPGAGASAVPGQSGRLRYTPSLPGQPPGVRTGRLRGAQNHAKLGRGRWAFGTDVNYGGFLERGTSRMAARPYLAGAAQRLKTRAQGIFSRSVAREIAKRAGRLG